MLCSSSALVGDLRPGYAERMQDEARSNDHDDPQSLLGRLRRGRGDAVRELLAQPADVAASTLVACLCTPAGLAPHVPGYAELVLALQPDLGPWFRWVDCLGADVDDDALVYVFNMLGELARRGHPSAGEFLRRYVAHGRHWQSALGQFVGGQPRLDVETWKVILPRVADEDLRWLLHEDLDADTWRQLAVGDERVRRLHGELLAKRGLKPGVDSWSPQNYGAAKLSQQRWKVLAALLRDDPVAAAPWLADGLWDATPVYRERCVEHCDPALPGVRERLAELAAEGGSPGARLARCRLAELASTDGSPSQARPAQIRLSNASATARSIRLDPSDHEVQIPGGRWITIVAEGASRDFVFELEQEEVGGLADQRIGLRLRHHGVAQAFLVVDSEGRRQRLP